MVSCTFCNSMNPGNLYPQLSPGSKLVLEPTGGLLIAAGADGLSAKNRICDLNPLALQIARRCDGSRTREELLAEVDDRCEGIAFDACRQPRSSSPI